ncbi:histidine-type phosphatase [Sphingomonas oryzagri]
MRRLATLIGAVALATPAVAAAPKLTVEHVVVLMRHGVRPPTKNPPMPAGIATDPWPNWDVPPGWLTSHGTEAIRLLGVADRASLVREGVLPRAGCPDARSVALISDSDQRTIATGDAWVEGLAPGCAITNRHKPQDVADPLFSPLGTHGDYDPAIADHAVRAALGRGGVAAVEKSEQAALHAIDRIYCGSKTSGCGVGATPSDLAPPTPGKKPKLTGALDTGSTAGQILLLEYADGKPMTDVGWGRVSAADIARVGSLHATEFRILARPRYMAERNVGGLAKLMADALGDGAPKVTMFVGHDTTVASLAGLLGLHWTVPGFATDDPAPGGALILEAVRDSAGRHFVRAVYRSQTLDQIRSLSKDRPVRRALTIEACAGPCSRGKLISLLRGR